VIADLMELLGAFAREHSLVAATLFAILTIAVAVWAAALRRRIDDEQALDAPDTHAALPDMRTADAARIERETDALLRAGLPRTRLRDLLRKYRQMPASYRAGARRQSTTDL
jgi:hypothetical protein